MRRAPDFVEVYADVARRLLERGPATFEDVVIAPESLDFVRHTAAQGYIGTLEAKILSPVGAGRLVHELVRYYPET